MDDDFKLTYKALESLLKQNHVQYKTNYKFSGSHHCVVPFYLPNFKLAIGVDDTLDRTPQEFQLAVKNQHQAQYCVRHHITYLTYDGRNDDLIKKHLRN